MDYYFVTMFIIFHWPTLGKPSFSLPVETTREAIVPNIQKTGEVTETYAVCPALMDHPFIKQDH